MNNFRLIGWLLVLAVAVGTPSIRAAEQATLSLDEFLQQIQGKDANKRREAWEKGAPLGAKAIAPLAKLLAKWEPDKVPEGKLDDARKQELDVAKAAGTAMDFIAHYACRPGADAGRKAMAAELVKLIGSDQAEPVRIKALFLLQSVGTDEEVPAVAKLLDASDPKMRERSRATLELIPGKASEAALLAALPKASGEFQRDIISTLGQKRSKAAVEPLMNLTKSGDPETSLSAIDALARIGDPKAAPVIDAATHALKGMPQKRALDDFLRLADNLMAAGDTPAAAAGYTNVLGGEGSDAIRSAALIGYAKTGAPETLRVILQAMTSPSARMRETAGRILVGMEGAEINPRLAQMAEKAQPPIKAILLRVLSERKAPQADALIQQASRDPNLEVRVTALDLLGGLNDPSLEPMLVEAAEKGSPEVKTVALRSYVKLAAARLQANDKAKAQAMYERALDLAGTDDVRRAALDGLANIASPDSLPRIEKLMAQGSSVRDEAARAYISIVTAMGKAGQKEEAIKRLNAMAEQRLSPDTMRAAISGLNALGADTSGFAGRLGFITHWWLLGPVSWNESTFNKSDFPVDNIAVDQPVKIGNQSFTWKELKAASPQGIVDLAAQFSPHENVAAYAYAEIEAPRARSVNLRIGSDDGFVCWVNGKEVGDRNVARPLTVDEDTIEKVPLVQGTNKVLLKITQGEGQWEFCVRVANTQNRPLDLTRMSER